MKEENANVYIGSCRNNFLVHQVFDVTFPILEESVIWVAPKLKQGQSWNFVTQFFTFTNWMLSIAVLIITALAFRYFATTAGKSDRKYRKLSECLLFIYSCFFNMGNSILPKDMKLRIICLSLGPFALNISAYLQGKLFVALTHPTYTENINTMEEMSVTIPLVVQEHMLLLLQNYKTNVPYNFVKSSRISMEYDLQDVVRFQDAGTVIHQDILKNHPNFIPYIQTHEIMKYQIVLYVMKNNKFYKTINDTVKKFVKHGIIKKMISDMKYIYALQCLKYRDCWSGHAQISNLTISNLRGAFFILVLGLGVSLLLFLLEVFCKYFNLRNLKNRFNRVASF